MGMPREEVAANSETIFGARALLRIIMVFKCSHKCSHCGRAFGIAHSLGEVCAEVSEESCGSSNGHVGKEEGHVQTK